MTPEEQITKIREDLLTVRSSQRRWGFFWALLGLVTLADPAAPIPIPLGILPSIVIGLASVCYGVLQLYRYQELPLSEAMEIAEIYKGFISGPLLVRTLHITPTTADRILDELSQRGYILPESSSVEGELGYRMPGLLPPAPAPAEENKNGPD